RPDHFSDFRFSDAHLSAQDEGHADALRRALEHMSEPSPYPSIQLPIPARDVGMDVIKKGGKGLEGIAFAGPHVEAPPQIVEFIWGPLGSKNDSAVLPPVGVRKPDTPDGFGSRSTVPEPSRVPHGVIRWPDELDVVPAIRCLHLVQDEAPPAR